MNTEPLIRVTVCVNRKPGTTEEEFNKYWAYQHGPFATEWLLRCGIVRYVQVSLLFLILRSIVTHLQYHTTSEYRDLAKKMSEAVGRQTLQYDGMVRAFSDSEAMRLTYGRVISGSASMRTSRMHSLIRSTRRRSDQMSSN